MVRGSLERLTPVLMTALSAPSRCAADDRPIRAGQGDPPPCAITIFGGLVTATVLDTLLTPVLFLRYGRKPLERWWRRRGRSSAGPTALSKPIEAY